MTIRGAKDYYSEGFRIMPARDIEIGSDYLLSYVEVEIMNTCQEREDLHNGYVEVDGRYWQAEMPV